jgi:hypothetical protein
VGCGSSLAPPADDVEEQISALVDHAGTARQWRLASVPVRATITGGPWTLGQGPASPTEPAKGYPTPNPGTNNMQPYFWPYTRGSDQVMFGLFDYRPRNMEEAVVAARSYDGGRSWGFVQEALDFNPNPTPDPLKGNENGQGHPYIIHVGGEILLYTLDRTPGVKDVGGLIVHKLSPTRHEPLRGAPANETPLSLATLRTTGLLNPEGIIGRVPGFRRPVIVYLQRVLGTGGPLTDVTTARLAVSRDGIAWRDLGPLQGLQDDGTKFLGARGAVLRSRHGSFVMFYSGGTDADGMSDAIRYIGYAQSTDLVHWHVVRGLANPLLSVETTEASGAPQSWWAGRAFGPSVTVSHDGRRATLLFAGFHTPTPNGDLGDYRQIGQVDMELSRGHHARADEDDDLFADGDDD